MSTLQKKSKNIKRRHKKIINQAFKELREKLLKLEQICQSCDEEDRLLLLQEGQEQAVLIGQMIEKNLEEEQTIHFLEDLCEVFYQISIHPEKAEHFIKEGWNLLEKAENRIEQLQLAPVELVFFPYKASMWDSLESIWKAARDDRECNTYVVPIPYYDMLPDHSDVRFNYEKDLFPADVPVVDWEDYRLEEQQPDIIVVHNPYDDCNRVTSVKPEYFSENLKKYTDLLVYVPYFMTTGRIPDGHIYFKSYINFDRIIVQNAGYVQKMKQYIPEEKLVPLGSPKCDCIVASMKNPTIPEEWKEKMEGKTVLFFNLSISCLLQADVEKYLEKVENFFELVYQYDNLVLIWRPHPLLEATINSMRGNLRQRILKMQEKFIKEKNTIYDRTANPEKTIAISDVYVGETESSIVAMFAFAKKPIFILSKDMYKEMDDKSSYLVDSVGMLLYKEHVYFIARQYHFLCRLNLKKNQTEITVNLSDYSQKMGNVLFIRHKNEIWIFLDKRIQDTILIYNCDDGHVEVLSWEVQSEASEDRIAGWFYDYDEDNSRNLYFWSKPGKIVLQIDMETREVKKRTEFVGRLLDNFKKDECMFGMSTPVREKIYCLSRCSNEIMEMDLSNDEITIHKVGSPAARYLYIHYYDGKFYLVEKGKACIYIWNPRNEELIRIEEMASDRVDLKERADVQERLPYALLFKPDSRLNEKKIYVFSNVANSIEELSCITNELKKTDWKLKETDKEHGYDISSNMFGYQIDEKNILCCLGKQKSFLLLNTDDGSYHIMPCELRGEEIRKFIKNRKHFRWHLQEEIYACKESELYRVNEFLKDLSMGKCDYEEDMLDVESRFSNSNGTVGVHVYQYLREQLKEL